MKRSARPRWKRRKPSGNRKHNTDQCRLCAKPKKHRKEQRDKEIDMAVEFVSR